MKSRKDTCDKLIENVDEYIYRYNSDKKYHLKTNTEVTEWAMTEIMIICVQHWAAILLYVKKSICIPVDMRMMQRNMKKKKKKDHTN